MRTRIALWTALTLAPGLAWTHPGEHGSGLAMGFMHPLLGLDHLLAMLAVGMLAALARGRAQWLLPASFLIAIAIGAVIGASGTSLPWVEAGIALSVLVLGLMIATKVRIAPAVATMLIGGFALLHGHAHGTEMQAGVDGLQYAAGFLLSTSMLHGLGMLFMRVLASSALAVRLGGSGIACVGASLLLLV